MSNPARPRKKRKPTKTKPSVRQAARIFALAIKALGDEETARAFVLAPHKYLGGEIPLKYLSNEVGALEVEQILNAILYGLPA